MGLFDKLKEKFEDAVHNDCDIHVDGAGNRICANCGFVNPEREKKCKATPNADKKARVKKLIDEGKKVAEIAKDVFK
uniref:Uncharacterized protein n=1 Tax=Chromera velia CCMP2878 TaxID=1169474 RepID=A0A0G4GKV5_9ALVE|eukprot:Cvel_4836.t1-p1 / transcript=Cvel_4836.t1 / gene=Cvel_4836 / organism=Chromera_velia_CCMP2878 / gene_product=hypothetical protein / transcript_product=hypothetical protein / location=Cvel_scaffold218:12944-13171(+) / protein_length=76 / sequence_SO=supercontig / SO=protein_coding / is_pseudo=false